MIKFIEKLANKLWTHSRDTTGDFGGRALLHVPVGIFISLCVLVHWALAIVMGYLFYKYERNEDAHTEDEAWKDLYGALVGVFIGVVIVVIVRWLL